MWGSSFAVHSVRQEPSIRLASALLPRVSDGDLHTACGQSPQSNFLKKHSKFRNLTDVQNEFAFIQMNVCSTPARPFLGGRSEPSRLI
jgi:hypothetical protein